MNTTTAISPGYTLGQMILYMLRLGTFGFGGPVALVGYMHRDLVERRRWISEQDYKEGLALAQMMPILSPHNSAFISATSITASSVQRRPVSLLSCRRS